MPKYRRTLADGKLSAAAYLEDYVNSLSFQNKARQYIGRSMFDTGIDADTYINTARRRAANFQGFEPVIHSSGFLSNLYNSVVYPTKQVASRYNTENKIDSCNADVDNGIVYIDTTYPMQDLESTRAHEYGHIVDGSIINTEGLFNSYNDKRATPYEHSYLYDKQNKNGSYIINGKEFKLDNPHDVNYHEIYGDLMQMRYNLYRDGIYDSRDNVPITEDQIRQYRQNRQKDKRLDRMLLRFDDYWLEKIINRIANNNNRKRQLELSGKYEV